MGPQIRNISLIRVNQYTAEREQRSALIASIPGIPAKDPPGSQSDPSFKVTLSQDAKELKQEYDDKLSDTEKEYNQERRKLELEYQQEKQRIESEYRRNKNIIAIA